MAEAKGLHLIAMRILPEAMIAAATVISALDAHQGPETSVGR